FGTQIISWRPVVRIAGEGQLAADRLRSLLRYRRDRRARSALLEPAERVGQPADQRPQDALGEWLLQVDLLETAHLCAQLHEPFGHWICLSSSDLLAQTDQRNTQNAGAAEQNRTHPYLHRDQL